MGNFLKRNAIFVLFPLVIIALVFLALINFSSGTRFSQWGTKSIVESTLVLLKEKVIGRFPKLSGHGLNDGVDEANVL